jgi:hypothetical protein
MWAATHVQTPAEIDAMIQGHPYRAASPLSAGDTFADRFRTRPTLGLRDVTFRLIEIGLLRLVPQSAVRRAKPFFILVGFDEEVVAKLHQVYRKHHISGVTAAIGPELSGARLIDELDGASGVGASIRFDFLSVLGPGGVAVLDMIRGGTFRPGAIHCADKGSFEDWSELRAGLIARGFVSIAEFEGAELLIDGPLFETPDDRPEISSFDVFDTLIARRCMEPWRVFEKVGKIIGEADFVQQRRAAEGRVLATRYVFDDIYDELTAHYGWSVERRREVQALEVSCELEMVIPINENLSRVRDGDLLVSDMYLSEAQIRDLLTKAGLRANVGLFVESHGKASGRAWPIVASQFKIASHLGDNPHADDAVPRRFGIPTEITRSSDLTIVEHTLMESGLRDLALLCREARLRSWHERPEIRALQAVQTSLNFPLLILASVFLGRRAVKLGSRSLAFCSRDCNVWHPLFKRLQAKMGLNLETRYFLTSRISRKMGSDAYLDYSRGQIANGAMVVDLCGTGWTMANLVERLGLESCDLFLIDHCPPLDVFERTKQTPKTCVVHTLFDQRPNANNIVLELANMADHGMIVDMRKVDASFVPILAPNSLSPMETQAIAEQRKCFLNCIELMEHYALRDVLDLDDESISILCKSLYEYMSKQTDCFQMFARAFLKENDEIVSAITAPKAQ